MKKQTETSLLEIAQRIREMREILGYSMQKMADLTEVSEETYRLAYIINVMHGVMCIFFWSASFTLPQALRACGDTRFVMIVSVASMWTFRLFLGTFLATKGGYGVVGIWMAMFVDWFCRIACFLLRWRSGKWEKMTVK